MVKDSWHSYLENASSLKPSLSMLQQALDPIKQHFLHSRLQNWHRPLTSKTKVLFTCDTSMPSEVATDLNMSLVLIWIGSAPVLRS